MQFSMTVMFEESIKVSFVCNTITFVSFSQLLSIIASNNDRKQFDVIISHIMHHLEYNDESTKVSKKCVGNKLKEKTFLSTKDFDVFQILKSKNQNIFAPNKKKQSCKRKKCEIRNRKLKKDEKIMMDKKIEDLLKNIMSGEHKSEMSADVKQKEIKKKNRKKNKKSSKKKCKKRRNLDIERLIHSKINVDHKKINKCGKLMKPSEMKRSQNENIAEPDEMKPSEIKRSQSKNISGLDEMEPSEMKKSQNENIAEPDEIEPSEMKRSQNENIAEPDEMEPSEMKRSQNENISEPDEMEPSEIKRSQSNNIAEPDDVEPSEMKRSQNENIAEPDEMEPSEMKRNQSEDIAEHDEMEPIEMKSSVEIKKFEPNEMKPRTNAFVTKSHKHQCSKCNTSCHLVSKNMIETTCKNGSNASRCHPIKSKCRPQIRHHEDMKKHYNHEVILERHEIIEFVMFRRKHYELWLSSMISNDFDLFRLQKFRLDVETNNEFMNIQNLCSENVFICNCHSCMSISIWAWMEETNRHHFLSWYCGSRVLVTIFVNKKSFFYVK
jgi:hypothetical protein